MSMNIHGAIKQVMVAQKAEPELAKLKKATDGFEAIFLKKLFSQMRSSVKETQFGQSLGKEIYNDMFDEALANAASKSKTLGMGDLLYNQFSSRVIDQVAASMAAEWNQPGAKPGPANLGPKPDLQGPANLRQTADITNKKS